MREDAASFGFRRWARLNAYLRQATLAVLDTWMLNSQRGSHKPFRHPDGRVTTVPVHPGRDIAPPLSRQIVKDIGPTLDEFPTKR